MSQSNVYTAYNQWADQYDTNENKTRDLEALALRTALSPIIFNSCLEMGCGTGKNTAWLVEKAKLITAVDLSEGMLEKARQKITSPSVSFVQADMTAEWDFVSRDYDVVTFSLVLEHIENLEPVLAKAARALKSGGYLYIGELHPFKQYIGSKARFETTDGVQVVTCYTHHLSHFTHAAKKGGLQVVDVTEYFDEGEEGLPRILSLLFQKP